MIVFKQSKNKYNERHHYSRFLFYFIFILYFFISYGYYYSKSIYVWKYLLKYFSKEISQRFYWIAWKTIALKILPKNVAYKNR